MKIKINKLFIRNFKGIKQFELTMNGENTAVYGENGTGKTTLYDAFLWCLFGKNSMDQSDTKFDWKPLDEDNNEIHHLETEVIVSLDIDGTVKEFGRNIKEKWTKKRGSIAETFDGHTTVYSIDGLNVKQKEFKEELSTIIDEDVFKIVTKLNYFPEVLDWRTRRQVLLDIVGDVSVEDVVKTDKELADVPGILDGKKVDDAMKLIKQRASKINEQLKSIPSRIDEVDRSLPDISTLDKGALEKKKLVLTADLTRHQTALSELTHGFDNAKYTSDIRELEVFKRESQQAYEREQEQALDELKAKRNDLVDDVYEARDLNSKLHRRRIELERAIADNQKNIETLERENDESRQRFNAIKAEQYPAFDDSQLICPSCQRPIEEHQAQELHMKHEQLVADFNEGKAKRLEQIRTKGIKNNETIQGIKNTIEDITTELAQLDIERHDQALISIQAQLKDLEEAIEKEKASIHPFDNTDEALEIDLKINALKNKLADGTKEKEAEATSIRETIQTLQTELNGVNDDLYKFELHAKQTERKEELISEEQVLAVEFSTLEQQKFMLEALIQAQVALLTDSINNRFKVVNFKLFKTNINGGIEECCEPTVNGVNYSTGLNNAARINAGLDIIQTLMAHYDTYVPVFIDNAEGVNELLEVPTQMITLSVSKDKELTTKEK